MDSTGDQLEQRTPEVQPAIEGTIQLDTEETFATVERRYFKRLYHKELDKDTGSSLDQVVLVHSNRICLVSLAPTHPVVAGNLKIRKIDFDGKTKFLNNKAVGKSKKQCSVVDERTVLAHIECEPDGKRFAFRSCVRGKLVEVNSAVIGNPQLMVEQPFGPGHLAVLHPHNQAQGIQELHNRLLSEEDYERQRNEGRKNQ